MDVIQQLRKRASSEKHDIVFPESDDPRIQHAAKQLVDRQICSVILLGDPEQLNGYRGDGSDGKFRITAVEPASDARLKSYAERYYRRRTEKGITLEEAEDNLKNPLYFAAAMVAGGDATGAVAGARFTTGEVLRAAIQTIGMREGVSLISSIFLMAMPDNRFFTYADCGVVPYPDAGELAQIAMESSRTHRLLTHEEPVTAMLSFSTKGSAQHKSVDLVRDALEEVRKRQPDLTIDGELQFDAAFVPEVGRRKAPGSQVAGRANVFIFPNLDAGNIAYKITERLGGAAATGPIIQGLAKPMMDLSRGCEVDDIVNAACVALLMREH